MNNIMDRAEPGSFIAAAKTFVTPKVIINKSEALHKIAWALNIEQKACDQMRIALLRSEYQMIDMSFLSMKNPDGSPAFAVFTLNNNKCEFVYHAEISSGFWRSSVSNKGIDLSNKKLRHIQQYYCSNTEYLHKIAQNKIKQLLKTNKSYNFEYHMYCEFEGLIPDTIKDKIKSCNKDFDEIYIVAEAPSWKHVDHTVELPIARDPLVVGFHSNTKTFYLIDSFDITLIEDMVKREFTSDKE